MRLHDVLIPRVHVYACCVGRTLRVRRKACPYSYRVLVGPRRQRKLERRYHGDTKR